LYRCDAADLLAMRRPPSPIEPIPDVARLLDLPSEAALHPEHWGELRLE